MINLQHVCFEVELSVVQCRVHGQVDGVLRLTSVVVVDQGRVRGDFTASGEPTHEGLLQGKRDWLGPKISNRGRLLLVPI